MKPFVRIAACIVALALSSGLAAQPASPIHLLEGKTIHASKFGMLYEQFNDNTGIREINHFIGKYNGNPSIVSAIDIADRRRLTAVSEAVNRYRYMDYKTGDFNGDGYDDYVWAVVDTNKKPYVRYTLIDTSVMQAASSSAFEINSFMSNVRSDQSRLYLTTGNFDGTGVRDFVVAFVNAAHQIELHWYGFNGGTNLAERSNTIVPKDSSFTPVTLDYVITSFHLCTGDFDSDGDDELAVLYLGPGIVNQQYITYLWAAVFEMENGQFIFKGSESLTGATDGEWCSIASGNFSGTNKKDLAFAYGEAVLTGQTGQIRVGIMKVDLSRDASNVIYDVLMLNQAFIGTFRCNLGTGDLNADGTDEIVWASGSQGNIISVNYSPWTLTAKSPIYTGAPLTFSNCGLQVVDVNKDGKADIVLAEQRITSMFEEFYIEIFSASSDLNTTSRKAYVKFDSWNNVYFDPVHGYTQHPPRRYVLAAGDFDGNDFIVGKPAYFRKNNIVQPLVILNAPPVHFDILHETAYDVTQCYNGNACAFSSTYYTANSTQIDVSTEVHQDWGVDAKLSAGGTFGFVDVGGYMSASYGEQFSNVSGTSTIINISTEVSAVEDDYIYASVSIFDFWEHPVYRKGRHLGHMLVVKPTVTANQWFPSKSWNAFTYIPNHEVGCILSYKDYPNLDNPDIDEKIKASYLGNSYTLGANNAFNWTLTFTDVTSNAASTTKNIGVEVGANAGTLGVSLETSAHYNRSQIQTYTSTVTNELSLQTSISSGLDMSIGEVRYTITPYAYWAQNGALVLDYAASPELQTTGGTPTWWYQNYNMQDPAFILPWRYDPEKGFAINDERKRRQTKSIMMLPSVAKSGDTVTLRAMIHNFGLVPSDADIPLRFYIGDPVRNDVITDIHGNSTFNIPVITERDRQIVEIRWKIPSGIYRLPKIYASIDPGNTITEIHRNNNIGWNFFEVTDGSPVDPDSTTSVGGHLGYESLMECFPNPFDHSIRLAYEMREAGRAVITLRDITGKVLATPVNEQRNPGVYAMQYDASALPSGIYLVHYQTPRHSQTRRLVKGVKP